MTRPTALAKLHATGNDFLVRLAMDAEKPERELTASVVARLCDRHVGVGADGLITIGPPEHASSQCSMVLQNADGGRAQMSGNGMRCLAWVADRGGLAHTDQLLVDTDAGTRAVTYERDASGHVTGADVDMGPVTFDPRCIPVHATSAFGLSTAVDGATYEGDAAGMGNPHLVCFVPDPAVVPVTAHGPIIEHDARFPERTNVEFVAVDARDRLRMRVWERGAGETLSCGTGACAAAAVAHRRGLVGTRVVVVVRGGQLRVTLGSTICLGGPVRHVFDTEVELE